MYNINLENLNKNKIINYNRHHKNTNTYAYIHVTIITCNYAHKFYAFKKLIKFVLKFRLLNYRMSQFRIRDW